MYFKIIKQIILAKLSRKIIHNNYYRENTI